MNNVGTQNFKSPAGKIFFSQQIPGDHAGNVETIRNAFAGLYEQVWTMIPEGRYRSLVLSNLETAGLYATKAFSHGDVNFGGGQGGSH